MTRLKWWAIFCLAVAILVSVFCILIDKSKQGDVIPVLSDSQMVYIVKGNDAVTFTNLGDPFIVLYTDCNGKEHKLEGKQKTDQITKESESKTEQKDKPYYLSFTLKDSEKVQIFGTYRSTPVFYSQTNFRLVKQYTWVYKFQCVFICFLACALIWFLGIISFI